MSTSFVSMWGCLVCSTVFQSTGNYKPASLWFGMAVIYGVFAVIEALKK